MITEKTKKLPKLFLIIYIVSLLLFIGAWFISSTLGYIPLLLLVFGIILPLLGLLLSYFLKKMIETDDPQIHFLVVLNIVALAIIILVFVVSLLIFYSDSLQSRLGEKYNAQVDLFVEAGDINGCVHYLLSKELVTEDEAQTICNLRIAIVTHNKTLCTQIPNEEKMETCLAAFDE